VLAEALDVSYAYLKTVVSGGNDLDDTIQRSHIPDHLQFILALSRPPVPSTVSYARHYLHQLRNPPLPARPLTWKDILEDERIIIEAENSSLDDGYTSGSITHGSSPSLSPWTSDEEDKEDANSPLPHDHGGVHYLGSDLKEVYPPIDYDPLVAYAHREAFDDLQSKQYWRTQCKHRQLPDMYFSLGDPSTLGRALQETVEPRSSLLISMELQTEAFLFVAL
jgi:gamma-tubulin complex component 5